MNSIKKIEIKFENSEVIEIDSKYVRKIFIRDFGVYNDSSLE